MDFMALGIAIIFFLVGFAGIFLPVLPGTILIFIGMLIYGFMTGFEKLDVWFFVIQALAVKITFFIDYAAAVIGTKYSGGGKRALLGAALGMFLGTIVLGPLGLIIGAFAGVLLGEIINGKDIKQGLKIATGTLVGFIGSAIIKVLVSIAMMLWFFLRVF